MLVLGRGSCLKTRVVLTHWHCQSRSVNSAGRQTTPAKTPHPPMLREAPLDVLSNMSNSFVEAAFSCVYIYICTYVCETSLNTLSAETFVLRVWWVGALNFFVWKLRGVCNGGFWRGRSDRSLHGGWRFFLSICRTWYPLGRVLRRWIRAKWATSFWRNFKKRTDWLPSDCWRGSG